jgi:adenosylcobinamide-GDP ribazoletransferase
VAPLLAMARFSYLRPGGTAAFHREHWAGLAVELRPTALVVALLMVVPLMLNPGAAGARGIWAGSGLGMAVLVGLAGLLPALVVPLWLGRRLGGHSGDSYGACVEWSEALTLLLCAALSLSGVASTAR